jgi:hypothetical protein
MAPGRSRQTGTSPANPRHRRRIHRFPPDSLCHNLDIAWTSALRSSVRAPLRLNSDSNTHRPKQARESGIFEQNHVFFAMSPFRTRLAATRRGARRGTSTPNALRRAPLRVAAKRVLKPLLSECTDLLYACSKESRSPAAVTHFQYCEILPLRKLTLRWSWSMPSMPSSILIHPLKPTRLSSVKMAS